MLYVFYNSKLERNIIIIIITTIIMKTEKHTVLTAKIWAGVAPSMLYLSLTLFIKA